MPLAEHVISEDHRLEEASESAADLAAHRWRWTLDELNPERVSLREYARQVARSRAEVAKDARGHDAHLRSLLDTLHGGPGRGE